MKNKLFNFFKCNQNAGTYTESDLSSEKYLSTKKWEWSYLRVRYWLPYFFIWKIFEIKWINISERMSKFRIRLILQNVHPSDAAELFDANVFHSNIRRYYTHRDFISWWWFCEFKVVKFIISEIYLLWKFNFKVITARSNVPKWLKIEIIFQIGHFDSSEPGRYSGQKWPKMWSHACLIHAPRRILVGII
jgi:hypothetical protein